MRSDIERRASDLVEHEEAQAARDKERRDHEHHESRLEEARRRIKEDDARAAAEQSRQEAEAEAEKLAVERYEVGRRFEEAAMVMNRTIAEYQSVHERHADALRRAGRPLGHGYRLPDIISRRWRQLFGGFNSATDTPAPHWNSEDRPLPEADPLARSDGS